MKHISKLFRGYFFAKDPDIFIGRCLSVENARTDPHLKEVAEFAVSEYKKSAKTCLKFEEVISAEGMRIAGSKFKPVISASDGDGRSSNGDSRRYEAVVWENYRELMSFKPI